MNHFHLNNNLTLSRPRARDKRFPHLGIDWQNEKLNQRGITDGSKYCGYEAKCEVVQQL